MAFELHEVPTSLDAHPTTSFLCSGLVDGTLSLLSYSIDDNAVSIVEEHRMRHKKGVRQAKFSQQGDQIFTSVSNKALCCWDVETAKRIRCLRSAHHSPPYSMVVISEHQLATGDETGHIRLWDWRHGSTDPIKEFQENDEYITDLAKDSSGKHLFSTSGDGTMSAFDLRKRKLLMQSETMHSELLCCCLVREVLLQVLGETKLLCGGSDGFVEIFNFHEWHNIADRIETNHFASVDRIVPFGHSMFVSGSSDGNLRLNHVMPNKSLGEIGAMDNVEDMCLGTEKKWLFACGLDSKIYAEDVDEAASKLNIRDAKSLKSAKKEFKIKQNNFFDDL